MIKSYEFIKTTDGIVFTLFNYVLTDSQHNIYKVHIFDEDYSDYPATINRVNGNT